MIESSTKFFWAESPGQIYPALKELVEKECIECCDQNAVGKRERKVYRITCEGRRRLKNWLVKPVGDMRIRDELLLKLFFGKNMETKEAVDLLVNRQKIMRDQIDYLNSVLDNFQREYSDDNDSDMFYWSLTVKNELYAAKAEAAWCHDTVKQLRDRKK